MNLSTDSAAEGRWGPARDADTIIKAPTLASVVARAIEDDVVARGWPVGEVLGSEADLLARYGVSRAVLREAVRIVEHGGAARMRRGPGGGLVVAEPNRDAVAAAMSVWFAYVGVTTLEITEAWGPLAVDAARLSAERAAPESAELARRLDALAAAGDDVDAGELSGVVGDIADLSGNLAISVFTRALIDLGMARISAATGESLRTTPEGRRRTLDGYRQVVAAIVAGDGEDAAGRMQSILADIHVRSEQPAAPAATRLPPGLPPGEGKLAERVVLAICHDIERAGWPVGEVIGSEADLIERFGVSHAILREAVRVLEHHGAVRTKRGPHGGLVVAAPDPSSVVHAARLVLERGGIRAEDVMAMRSAVEVTAVRLAAARCTDEDAARLRLVLAQDTGADVATEFQSVHTAIAEVARNRPVHLFVAVAAQLVAAHLPPAPSLVPVVDEVRRAHERVIEAVIARDPDLGERRMLRHLRAGVDHLA